MTIRYTILIVSLWLSCLGLSAQDDGAKSAQSSWELCYHAADYQGAVQALEQDIRDKGATAERYYNLGVCYDRLGRPAQSLLAYERSLWVDPTMKYSRHNLRLGYDRLPNALSDGRAFAILDDICYAYSMPTLMIIGVLLMLLIAGGLIMFRLGSTVLVRQLSFYTAVGLFALWLLLGAMILHHWYYRGVGEKRAIVVEATQLKSAPASAEAILDLSAGSPLQMEESQEGWTRVMLYDGRYGYVPTHTIEQVVAPL